MKKIIATSAQMEKTSKVVGNATGGFAFKGGYDNVNWKLVRAMCNIGYSFMKKEKGVTVQKLDLNGIYGELTRPDNRINDNIIMYIHGGGLVSGSAKATRAYCSVLARFSGYDVVSIDYRLAPENTYPAAIDDCERAFLALHEQFPKAKICLTGESAGGYLSLVTTVRLISKNEFLPACLLPQSPLCDLTGDLDRSYYEIKDNTVAPEGLTPLMDMYAPGIDRKNPEISCLYFDQLEKFPPVLMSFDANETLRADAEKMNEALKAKGVDSDCIMMVHTFHACSTAGIGTPETFELLMDDIEFLRKHFGDNYLDRE